jgi:hypothetical protein
MPGIRILGAAALCSLLLWPERAFAAPELIVGSSLAQAGETVRIGVRYTGDGRAAALAFAVRFDSSSLAPAEVEAGSVLRGGTHRLAAHEPVPGELRVLVRPEAGAERPELPSGVLLELAFAVAADAAAGRRELLLERLVLGDAAGGRVEPTRQEGGSILVGWTLRAAGWPWPAALLGLLAATAAALRRGLPPRSAGRT